MRIHSLGRHILRTPARNDDVFKEALSKYFNVNSSNSAGNCRTDLSAILPTRSMQFSLHLLMSVLQDGVKRGGSKSLIGGVILCIPANGTFTQL